MSGTRSDILQGWKEIAGYLSRDVRTVRRWEEQRGLPVRRMPGSGRANVYAVVSDLDHWLSRVPAAPEALPTPDASDENGPAGFKRRSTDISVAPYSADTKITHANPEEIEPSVAVSDLKQAVGGMHTASRRWILYSLVAITCVAAICALTFAILTHRMQTPQAAAKSLSGPVRTAAGLPYSSKVPGVDDLYLRGVYFNEQRTPDTLNRALQCFLNAISKDPNYAPAWSGLSSTYNLLREYSMMSSAEAYPKARAAAQRAIALDPSLSLAHASLAFVDFFWSWNSTAAEREFRTAIALDPGEPQPHHWYGSMLLHEGRYSKALEQLNLAQRLKPDSTSILSTRALALGLSGHRSEAADILQEVVNADRMSSSPHAILAALSTIEPRDLPRYIAETEIADELRHDNEDRKIFRSAERAYRRFGEEGMWHAILTGEQRAKTPATSRNYRIAQAEAALGENEAALADLQQLLKRRDPSIIGIAVDPIFIPLHPDPRYKQMLAAANLPPVQ